MDCGLSKYLTLASTLAARYAVISAVFRAPTTSCKYPPDDLAKLSDVE